MSAILLAFKKARHFLSGLFFQFEARKSNGFITPNGRSFLAFQVICFIPAVHFFFLPLFGEFGIGSSSRLTPT